jgi:hypothetical protein
MNHFAFLLSITTSYSTGTVSGNSYVGGLAAYNYYANITTSYSTGSVSGTSYVGGLVGVNNGTVMGCYSTGAVGGTSSVGGLVGLNRGSVLHSVWDMDTSGVSASTAGVGLTTAEMMDPYMLGLNGFANDPNWVLDAGRDYPRLAWESTPGQIIPEPAIEWPQGHGTAEDPYRIDSAEQLIFLGRASALCDRHFVLGADIDLDPNLPGRQIFRQAVIPTFTGVFDGNGHGISHLTITGGGYLGLFAYLGSAAELRNLAVADINVSGSGTYVGGLVGYNYYGSITTSSSTGTVSGDGFVGGLVGSNSGSITTSYSTATVSGSGQSASVGGLLGYNSFGGSVTDCYSTGAASGNYSVGGLVGVNYRGDVTGCFWDIQTSGQDASSGGTGKTTAEMQAASTFLNAGWDFVGETIKGTEDVWGILEDKDYPRLAWEFWAFSPDPSNGATKFIQCPALIWVAARAALAHDIYFGEELGLVADATSQTQAIYRGRKAAEMTRYDPGILELDKTYYWRIDEVNEADPNSPWKGSVWSFTTVDYIVTSVVDDFEIYTDDVGRRVFQTWKDGRGYTEPPPGYSGNGTGSTVGYVDPPFAEQVIVHGGRQSMPMKYNNVSKPWYSEAERTWETPQDWTVGGADTLTLYFRGWADNGRQPLYVGIEDSAGQIAVIVHPDADALLATEWQKWHIPLADVRGAGVDVAAVKRMYIGVGDRKNPQPGGTGTIYIDDIRLTYRNFVVGDFDGDGYTDFADFCIFGQHWLGSDSSFWCGGGTDLTSDAFVDWQDLMVLAENWLD